MQVKDVNYGKTVRKSYAKYQEILQMPNLLKIQKDSYDWFLREGLHEVFRDVTFMDSSGIAVVIHTLRRMNTLQGRLLLQNIPPQPYKVLRAAGIEKITEIREECNR